MKISELLEALGEAQGMFGDIPVCMAQLQKNGTTVRLTGAQQIVVQYGVLYVTNMNDEQIALTMEWIFDPAQR